jgi:hypothetical protein
MRLGRLANKVDPKQVNGFWSSVNVATLRVLLRFEQARHQWKEEIQPVRPLQKLAPVDDAIQG